MTVCLASEGTIELEGVCSIEDAEKLQRYLIADPRAPIDWRSCIAAHTSVIQILLAAKPVVYGPPVGEFLRNHVAPLMKLERRGLAEKNPQR